MKRWAIAVMTVLVCVWSTSVFAAGLVPQTSGDKTADAAIVAGSAYVIGVLITADGTNACKVALYDNATTNAGKNFSFNAAAGTGDTTGFLMPSPVLYDNGIYAKATVGGGGSCTYSVIYR